MELIKDIKEALYFLKQGCLICTNKNDVFVMRNDKIHHYDNGNHFVLSIDDFYELYNKNCFYIYEETVEIDEAKDETYYRFYKK